MNECLGSRYIEAFLHGGNSQSLRLSTLSHPFLIVYFQRGWSGQGEAGGIQVLEVEHHDREPTHQRQAAQHGKNKQNASQR